MLVGMLVLALCVGVATAKDKGTKPQMARGEITVIDGANITIQPGTPDGATTKPAPVTFATDSNTTVTIDGATKAVTDLTKGQKILVTLTDDRKTATAIVSPIPAKKK